MIFLPHPWAMVWADRVPFQPGFLHDKPLLHGWLLCPAPKIFAACFPTGGFCQYVLTEDGGSCHIGAYLCYHCVPVTSTDSLRNTVCDFFRPLSSFAQALRRELHGLSERFWVCSLICRFSLGQIQVLSHDSLRVFLGKRNWLQRQGAIWAGTLKDGFFVWLSEGLGE